MSATAMFVFVKNNYLIIITQVFSTAYFPCLLAMHKGGVKNCLSVFSPLYHFRIGENHKYEY